MACEHQPQNDNVDFDGLSAQGLDNLAIEQQPHKSKFCSWYDCQDDLYHADLCLFLDTLREAIAEKSHKTADFFRMGGGGLNPIP